MGFSKPYHSSANTENPFLYHKRYHCSISNFRIFISILYSNFCTSRYSIFLIFLLDFYRPVSCCFLCSLSLIFASFSSARSTFKLLIGSDTIYIIRIGIGHCMRLCGNLYLTKLYNDLFRPSPCN